MCFGASFYYFSCFKIFPLPENEKSQKINTNGLKIRTVYNFIDNCILNYIHIVWLLRQKIVQIVIYSETWHRYAIGYGEYRMERLPKFEQGKVPNSALTK
jgi:hypothetical protein